MIEEQLCIKKVACLITKQYKLSRDTLYNLKYMKTLGNTIIRISYLVILKYHCNGTLDNNTKSTKN